MVITNNQFKRAFDDRLNSIFSFTGVDYIAGGTLAFTDWKMLENKLWYFGDSTDLCKFYKTVKTIRPFNDQLYNFYAVVNTDEFRIPVIHCNLSNVITKCMTNLVFGEDPAITISTGNKSKDKKLKQIIDDIYKDNNKSELFQKASALESYSGAVAFKIVIDKEFSEYPMAIPYPKEDVEIKTKYNDRIYEIIFKDYYKKGTDRYTLKSIYGKGYIKYSLRDSKDNEVSLSKLEETKNLKDIYFSNNDGSKFNRIMAVYKKNNAGATSDYDGIKDTLISIDEILSNIMDLTRKSKMITYRPEYTLKKNKEGKVIPNNGYNYNEVILYDAKPTQVQAHVERDIADVRNNIEALRDTYNNLIKEALIEAGISPATAGLDLAGANSSGTALEIREKVSLRTRAEKINRWSDTIKDLTELLLAYYFATQDAKTVRVNDFNDVIVEFGQYEKPSYDSQINSLGAALDAGLITRLEALKEIYPDRPEEDLKIMLLDIEGELPISGEEIANRAAMEEDDSDDNQSDSDIDE
jgi:hypothetical protein